MFNCKTLCHKSFIQRFTGLYIDVAVCHECTQTTADLRVEVYSTCQLYIVSAPISTTTVSAVQMIIHLNVWDQK